MSFEDIQIIRQINIINGFARSPEALEKDRNADALRVENVLAEIPNIALKKLESQFSGGHKTAGGKFGVQEFFETSGSNRLLESLAQLFWSGLTVDDWSSMTADDWADMGL